MRLDDLTRELQAQAEESHAWPVPRVPLRTRRPRRRRQLGLVAVSVVAVAAILVGFPRLIHDDSAPRRVTTAPPSATPSAAAETPIRTWTALHCPAAGPRSCPVPWILGLPGQRYASGSGARQPVFGGGMLSTAVSVSLPGQPPGRLVMVGATRAGAGSRIVARLGDAAPFVVPDNGLVLVRLPPSARAVEVWVTERGTPQRRETLVIEEYRPIAPPAG